MTEVSYTVKRNVEGANGEKVDKQTKVKFRRAETITEMTEFAGNELGKALKFYNLGRWMTLRTKVSNSLANKTPKQRSAEKLLDAYATLNPGLDAATIRTLVLSMPGMADAFASAGADIPADTDEAYWASAAPDTDEDEAEGEETAEVTTPVSA